MISFPLHFKMPMGVFAKADMKMGSTVEPDTELLSWTYRETT